MFKDHIMIEKNIIQINVDVLDAASVIKNKRNNDENNGLTVEEINSITYRIIFPDGFVVTSWENRKLIQEIWEPKNKKGMMMDGGSTIHDSE
ncbi:hypothetical protein [Carnobacterium pleistocenium]|uniref:hypothetical protein n=1 Tax=Carnobacterium pleistocenium TaxID=181073 RepID=UPI000553F140|nr:hypothetical protein [Carnobacterium pleistocenium]